MKQVTALLLLTLLGLIFYQVRGEMRSVGVFGDAGLWNAGYGLNPAVVVPTADGDKDKAPAATVRVPEQVSEVQIENVYQAGEGLVVMLELKKGDIDGKKFLPIFVGINEARAIAWELARPRVVPPRPMTHDLLRAVIRSLNGKVERVTVTRLVGGTYYAAITISAGDRRLHVDARPSDSMALAIRVQAKIFVADQVMRDAGQDTVSLTRKDEARERLPVGAQERQMYFQKKGYY